MAGPTRWGICGTGKVAHDFCHVLKTLPQSEHQIVAVAASTADKAAAFASEFGIPVSYGSYEELAKQDNIDIIYINLHHMFHVKTSLLYINAGKNVICEKPMALTLEGCQKVLSAAKEKGVFFAEGYWSRYFPAYDQIKAIVDSGEIGDIRMINAHFSFTCPDFPNNSTDTGAGIFMATGLYTVMFANFLFKGKPEKINTVGVVREGGSDASEAIILKYSGGRLAVLSSTAEAELAMNNAVVRGTKGNIQLPDFFWCPDKLIMPDGQIKEFPLLDVTTMGVKENYPHAGGFLYEIQGTRECLLKGLKESPKLPFQDMEDIMTIVDEIVRQMGLSYPAGH